MEKNAKFLLFHSLTFTFPQPNVMNLYTYQTQFEFGLCLFCCSGVMALYILKYAIYLQASVSHGQFFFYPKMEILIVLFTCLQILPCIKG